METHEAIKVMTSMDWITFGIAVGGFIMSAATWVHTFMTQRKKFDLAIFEIKSYSTVTYLQLSIENKSRIPIAVTRISILLNGKPFDCTAVPKIVCAREKKRNNEVISRTETFSTALPVQLSSLGAVSCLVLFENLPELPPDESTHLTFQIYTNRGKPVQKTLALPEGWADQRNVL